MLSKINLPTNTDLTIDATVHNKIYLKGNGVTLATDVSVNLTGTPYEGLEVELFFDSGGVLVDGNVFTIFGKVLTPFADENLKIFAVYVNAGWKVFVSSLTPEAALVPFELADSSVLATKLADLSVTARATIQNLKRETLNFRFDTSTTPSPSSGQQIWIDGRYKIVRIGYDVETVMVTDSAALNVSYLAYGGNIYTASIPITDNAATRVVESPDIVGSETVNAGDWLLVNVVKTTAGGILNVSVVVEKVDLTV
jgi:hypothetical protein